MKNILIIEFLGAPGTGKTTLSTELIKSLKEKNEQIYSREDIYSWYHGLSFGGKFFLFLSHFKTIFWTFFNVLLILMGRNQKKHIRKRFLWILTFPTMLKKFSRENKGIIVLDEGLLNWVSGLSTDFNRSVNANLICGILKKQNIKMVVYIDRNISNSFEVNANQKSESSNLKNYQYCYDEYKKLHKNIGEVFEKVKSCQICFCAIDNESVKKGVARIRNIIHQIK